MGWDLAWRGRCYDRRVSSFRLSRSILRLIEKGLRNEGWFYGQGGRNARPSYKVAAAGYQQCQAKVD